MHKAQSAWKGLVYREVSAFVCLPVFILSPIHKLSGKFQPLSLLHQDSLDHLVLNIRVGSSNVIAPLDMPPVQCLIRQGIGQSKDSYLQAAILGRCVSENQEWQFHEVKDRHEQDHSQADWTFKTSSLVSVSSGYLHFLSVPPSVTNFDQL